VTPLKERMARIAIGRRAHKVKRINMRLATLLRRNIISIFIFSNLYQYFEARPRYPPLLALTMSSRLTLAVRGGLLFLSLPLL